MGCPSHKAVRSRSGYDRDCCNKLPYPNQVSVESLSVFGPIFNFRVDALCQLFIGLRSGRNLLKPFYGHVFLFNSGENTFL